MPISEINAFDAAGGRSGPKLGTGSGFYVVAVRFGIESEGVFVGTDHWCQIGCAISIRVGKEFFACLLVGVKEGICLDHLVCFY